MKHEHNSMSKRAKRHKDDCQQENSVEIEFLRRFTRAAKNFWMVFVFIVSKCEYQVDAIATYFDSQKQTR